MSNPLAERMYLAQDLKALIAGELGRSVGRETFRRWKRALAVSPVQVEKGRYYYSERDAKKLYALAVGLSSVRDIDSVVEIVLEGLNHHAD